MTSLKFYISAIFQSLFSREFYYDLISNKNIFGFRYVFLIALILAVPVSMQVKYLLNTLVVKEAGAFHEVSNDEISREINHISVQLPKLTFEKNNFVSSDAEPSYIYASDKTLIAIIDTDRKVNNIDTLGNVALLRGNELKIIVDGSLSAIVSAGDLYQSFQDYFKVNGEGKPEFITKKFLQDFYAVITIPYPVIFFFCFLWMAFKYFFKAVLYSFIAGMIINLMLKPERFDLKLCIRIAAFTSTAVAVLEFLSFSLGQNIFVFSNLVYFITHILYIYFAVESYKKLRVRK